MKISNSKKQLAKIIRENGGWREGAKFAAQGGNYGHVGFASEAPVRNGKVWDMTRGFAGKFLAGTLLPHWHQTILSRDEYFHLYPAQDAAAEESEHVWTNPPTIEQLASDYRAKLAIAQQAQEEANSHRCGAEAALEKLVAAGEALGLALSVAAPEPELLITDWRDLQVGDWVWVEKEDHRVLEGEYEVLEVEAPGYDGRRTFRIKGGKDSKFWINYENGWRFIRRPTKGDANA